MNDMRESIIKEELDEFVEKFLNNYYEKEENYPDWVSLAIELSGLNIGKIKKLNNN